MNERFTLRIPSSLHKQLAAIAAEQGVSLNALLVSEIEAKAAEAPKLPPLTPLETIKMLALTMGGVNEISVAKGLQLILSICRNNGAMATLDALLIRHKANTGG